MAQFPPYMIDPQKKDANWVLQFCKAVWNEHKNTSGNSFAKGADRYQRIKKYSLGKQSNQKYKRIFRSDADKNSSFLNINWDVLPVLPKFRRIVVERIGKIKLEAEATAIDAMALKDKKKYEAREKSNITLREDLGAVGANPAVLDSGEATQPKTMEELAIKMEFEYKHNMAMDVEKRIEAAFAENKIDEILNEVTLNLFDDGVGGVRDWTDPVTGRARFRTVQASNLVLPPVKSQFFRDATYIGEIIYMTIEEIRKAAPNIKEEALEELAYRSRGKYGNAKEWGDATPYNKGYDNFRIAVLDLNYLTVDRIVYEKWVNRLGNPQIAKTKWKNQFKKRKGRETYNDDRMMWYEAKWVVDSDIVFDMSIEKNMKRRPSRVWDAIPSFHIVAPELYNMETTSMAEQVIPLIDQILIAWYKLQNVIALARPAGISIEIGALEDISMGDGDENWTPMQVLDLFNQTGSIVWRRVDVDGNYSNYKPIEQLQNGIGQEAAEHFSVIDRYFGMIRDMLGFNDVTDGSTPDARMLNGVANLADQSTSNSIYHIARARRNIFERLADSVAIRVHDAVAFSDKDAYADILGAEGLKSAKEDKYKTHREFGIIVRDQDDPQEKERLNLDIAEAVKNGQITIADKIFIMSIDNLKQRGMLLAYRIKKNEDIRQAAAERDKMTNAQVQQDSARVAEEEKRKTLQEELNKETVAAKVKGEEERKTLELKYKFEKELKEMELGMRFGTEVTKEGMKAQQGGEQMQPEPQPPAA